MKIKPVYFGQRERGIGALTVDTYLLMVNFHNAKKINVSTVFL